MSPGDTEQQKSAIFEREDGATRHVDGSTMGRARTAYGLDTQTVFARRKVVFQDVA